MVQRAPTRCGTRLDLVLWTFTATSRNQPLAVDVPCYRTSTDWAYAAFVIDMFARRGAWMTVVHLAANRLGPEQVLIAGA